MNTKFSIQRKKNSSEINYSDCKTVNTAVASVIFRGEKFTLVFE